MIRAHSYPQLSAETRKQETRTNQSSQHASSGSAASDAVRLLSQATSFTPSSSPSKGQTPKKSLRQAILGYFLPRRSASAPPAVRNIELQDMSISSQVPGTPEKTPNAALTEPSGQKPEKRVRFQEVTEQVSLEDGSVLLNRASYTDMRLAQQELDGYMRALKQRAGEFPKGDAQDLVRDAVRHYHTPQAQDERADLGTSISNLLRYGRFEHGSATQDALARQFLRVGLSLGGVDRTLKTAQEEMAYLGKPEDPGIQAIRGCIDKYRQALEQLQPPQNPQVEPAQPSIPAAPRPLRWTAGSRRIAQKK